MTGKIKHHKEEAFISPRSSGKKASP